MIKFVIIDNDNKYINEFERIINEVLFMSDKEYDFYIFKRYNEDLKEIIKDNSEQKIYLVDLEIDGKYSGMDILKEIREEDWDSEIIVLTNHDRMFETVHREIYKIFNFIEKFNNFEKILKKDLKLIISKKYDNTRFIYKTNKISLQIYMKDILYIFRDTVDRKLVIKTTNNEFLVNLSIIEILKKLDNRFIQCHKSCVINEDKIVEKNYSNGYFITVTGEKVNLLSKKFKTLTK